MSAAAIRKLKEIYHVDRFVDLRTAEEIEGSPIPQSEGIHVVHVPILKQAMRGITRDSEPMRKKMQAILSAGMTEEEFMRQCYREMVSSPEAMKGYHRLFELLLDGEAHATMFFCSAGRDRTGIAAWLILSALGVPEEDILRDYLMTPFKLRRKSWGVALLKILHYFEEKEANFALAFMLPSRKRILGAIAWVQEEYGDVYTYLQKGIGLSDSEIEAFRAKYLMTGGHHA